MARLEAHLTPTLGLAPHNPGMHPPRRAFWVTVEHAPGRTQDHRIEAPTLWSAGWLFRQLNPGATVRMVRPVPHRQEA